MKRVDLTRADIERGLKRLSELAVAAHRMVDIAIYGGSAIMLAWNLRTLTNDVDAIVMDARHTTFVRDAVRQVAAEMGWHEDWFNEAIKGYIRVSQHLEKLPLFPEREDGGVRIYVPTPEYFLALKCMAMRLEDTNKQDGKDIKNVLRMLNITEPEAVYDIVEKYYPQNVILPRVQYGIQQLLAELEDEDRLEGLSP